MGFYLALTKAMIVGKLTEDLGFTRKQAREATKSILEIIKLNLESGEDVLISGFGKFCVKAKMGQR